RIERRHAGAHERSRVDEREAVWNACERARRNDDVIGVASVVRNPGNFRCDLAHDEIAAAAGIAITAMTAVPSDADPLSFRPAHDTGAESVDRSGDLVSGRTRVLDARPLA